MKVWPKSGKAISFFVNIRREMWRPVEQDDATAAPSCEKDYEYKLNELFVTISLLASLLLFEQFPVSVFSLIER